MKKLLAINDTTLSLDSEYRDFLSNIKDRLKTAQIKAALSANCELIKFYWQLGTDLIEKQKTRQWGDHFLEQLSHDMRLAFPKMQGFSKRNLEYMLRFASTYPNLLIAKQPVSQLPWGHIVKLLQMVKIEPIRDWYAHQAARHCY